MNNLAVEQSFDRSDISKSIDRVIEGGPIAPDARVRGVWRTTASAHGPHLLVLAGVHGNEPSGFWAMTRLMDEITQGQLQLLSGSITFAIGNELAIREDKRQVKYNLNRLFGRSDIKAVGEYEYERARALEPVVAEVDAVMDFHSTSQPSPAFALLHHRRLTDGIELGFPHIMYGDTDFFRTSVSGTAIGYAESKNISGIVIEAGQHLAPASFQSAYRFMRAFLSRHGVISAPVFEDMGHTTAYSFFHRERLKAKDFQYSQKFETFFWLKPDTVIGRYSHEEVVARRHCVIVMPTDPAILDIDEVMYYLAAPTVWS